MLGWVRATPWAVTPTMLATILEIARRHASGEKLSAADIAARIGDRQRPTGSIQGDIAVLPMHGVVVPRANLMSEVSGATSAEAFGRAFTAAMNDQRIGAVVIDTDSPGGSVAGVDELSRLIYDARGTKPIVAVANHLMASAAYWIGTAADELVMTPSAEVGSVGVFAAHEDVSAAQEKAGVKTTLVSAGEFKTQGNPYEPLTEEALATIQARVDDYYGMFVKAVARNRGVSVAAVREDYGKGLAFGAAQALAAGMVDRIETLDQTLVRLAKGQKGRTMSASAELDFRQRRARAIG
ncbi:S49 family peptidase [Casimicrobium huifangae]|uniref:S49 family peptidase n=1 Tax=Casimicrobium huifangae TaxID=2591109 RepID=UPI003784C450